MRGEVLVARVPGVLHFEAGASRAESLNLAYTNVSHTVRHLSFEPFDGVGGAGAEGG